MKLLCPLSLILLGLALCQCRMSRFSTFSPNDGGDTPKIPTVRVPLPDNVYDSNYAVLPPGTAISDGSELSVVSGAKISAIKAMFESDAAKISEVVGPTGEILADGESIANGESIELVFSDPSGGRLRATVTGSLELQQRIDAKAKAKAELDKLKDRVNVGDKPSSLPDTGLVTLDQLASSLTEANFVKAGQTRDTNVALTFRVEKDFSDPTQTLIVTANCGSRRHNTGEANRVAV